MPYKDPETQRKATREWIAERRRAWLEAHPCGRCGRPSAGLAASVGHLPKGAFSMRPERLDATLEACRAEALCADHWDEVRRARASATALSKRNPGSFSTRSRPWEDPAYRAEVARLVGCDEKSPEWWAALILLAAPTVGPENAWPAVGAPPALGEQVAGRMRGCGAWVKLDAHWVFHHEWLDFADPGGPNAELFEVGLVLDVLTALGQVERSVDPDGALQYRRPRPHPEVPAPVANEVVVEPPEPEPEPVESPEPEPEPLEPPRTAPRKSVAVKRDRVSRSTVVSRPRSPAPVVPGHSRSVAPPCDDDDAPEDDDGRFDRRRWRAERRARLGYGLAANGNGNGNGNGDTFTE